VLVMERHPVPAAPARAALQHHLSLELTGCDLAVAADPGALLDLAAALLEAIDDEARDGALPMHLAVRDALWAEWSVIQIAECCSISARVDEASGDARMEIASLRPFDAEALIALIRERLGPHAILRRGASVG
jgi:hypothetical protein